jgi:hypothetical protein
LDLVIRVREEECRGEDEEEEEERRAELLRNESPIPPCLNTTNPGASSRLSLKAVVDRHPQDGNCSGSDVCLPETMHSPERSVTAVLLGKLSRYGLRGTDDSISASASMLSVLPPRFERLMNFHLT